MPAATRTFGLEQTFIEPQVLSPPPTRHALFVFLVLLASILHIGTASWSDIHNGAEGHYASAAREMFRTGSWIPPANEPPLITWLLVVSYNIFGVTATAARLPIAAAVVASVALTFLIGERLAGYWRGFVAGLVHLCCLGSFIWGRLVTAEPIFAACIGGAIFCAVCGFQRQRTRRRWFAAVWVCVALAVLSKGFAGLVYPALIFLALACSYREARLRFRGLLHWQYLLLLLLLVLPPVFWLSQSLAALASFGNQAESMALPKFLLANATWSFPGLLLVLPGLLFATRRVVRPHEFEFADALPLCWFAVGFLPLLLLTGRQDYDSMAVWSAGALWVAAVWDRTPRALRLAGICLTAIVLTAAAWLIVLERLPFVSSAAWPTMNAVVSLIAVVSSLALVLAGYFAWRHREDLAITTVLLAMVPIGLLAAEGMARHGTQFSLARAAEFLQPLVGDEGEVLFEGSPAAGSSLAFYLDRAPLLVRASGPSAPDSPALDRETALARMGSSHQVYLIAHRDHLPSWQERLTERFHIYHQVTTCGPYVVINNHQ